MARNQSPEFEQHEMQLAVEDAARRMLADAGVHKPDDLAAGRADMGRVAEVFTRAGIDEELNPLDAEKALRNAEFDDMAGSPAQPLPRQTQDPTGAQGDRLAEIQAQLDAAQAEAERFKGLYGKSENDKGSIRRRLREIEEKVGGRQSYQPNPGYQPYGIPAVPGIDPQAPATMGEVTNLLLSFAQAQGEVLRRGQEEAFERIRSLPRDYNLTANEEEDLLDEHPWMRSLPPGQREQAMFTVARNSQPAPRAPSGLQPRTPTPPRSPTQEDILRARVRQAGYVEAQTGTPRQERNATSSAASDQAQRWKALQAALSKTDGTGSKEAEKILAAMGAGITEDSDVGFPRR